jgi:hypothetical protein
MNSLAKAVNFDAKHHVGGFVDSQAGCAAGLFPAPAERYVRAT